MLEKEKKLFAHITEQGERIRAKKRVTRDKDETIALKEKEIYELKKKNQELEKFKFVLDYRIKELKKQIEPREREITEMKDNIKTIDAELEKYHSSNARLDATIGDLRQELDDCQSKITRNSTVLAQSQQTIKSFQTRLHRTIQHVQDPAKLDAAVIDLRNRFVKEDVEVKEADTAVVAEFERQRQYLESTVSVLKAKSQALSDFNARQNQKLMHENMELIADIKDLRQAIKTIRLAPLLPQGQAANAGSVRTALRFFCFLQFLLKLFIHKKEAFFCQVCDALFADHGRLFFSLFRECSRTVLCRPKSFDSSKSKPTKSLSCTSGLLRRRNGRGQVDQCREGVCHRWKAWRVVVVGPRWVQQRWIPTKRFLKPIWKFVTVLRLEALCLRGCE